MDISAVQGSDLCAEQKSFNFWDVFKFCSIIHYSHIKVISHECRWWVKPGRVMWKMLSRHKKLQLSQHGKLSRRCVLCMLHAGEISQPILMQTNRRFIFCRMIFSQSGNANFPVMMLKLYSQILSLQCNIVLGNPESWNLYGHHSTRSIYQDSQTFLICIFYDLYCM